MRVSLVLSLIFPSLAISLAFPNKPTQPIRAHNLTSADSLAQCSGSGGRATRPFPNLANCAAALLALPSGSEEAIFHNGGPNDGFQLPIFERSKDCEVLVETYPFGTDPVSSWAEIGLAAMQLGVACFSAGAMNVQGQTFCGGGDMVKISLRGFGVREAEDPAANATAEGTATA